MSLGQLLQWAIRSITILSNGTLIICRGTEVVGLAIGIQSRRRNSVRPPGGLLTKRTFIGFCLGFYPPLSVPQTNDCGIGLILPFGILEVLIAAPVLAPIVRLFYIISPLHHKMWPWAFDFPLYWDPNHFDYFLSNTVVQSIIGLVLPKILV